MNRCHSKPNRELVTGRTTMILKTDKTQLADVPQIPVGNVPENNVRRRGARMLTGELRNQIDSIWNDFWFGGLSSPAQIDQIAGTLMMVRSPRVWSCSRLALTSSTQASTASRLGNS